MKSLKFGDEEHLLVYLLAICIFSFLYALFLLFLSVSSFLDSWGYFLPPEKSVCLLPASWEICMQVKKQQLELDMEKHTGSKLGKEYVKSVYCHPAYLTYLQSTSWEMLGWMKHKLESRLPGEISITSDVQMTPPLWQKVKNNQTASWWKWKRRVKKLT